MVPVILHHGLFGFGNLRIGPLSMRYFAGGIERALTDAGHPLIVARVHPTGSIELRAKQLKATILQQLAVLRAGDGAPSGRAIILAHSMGGLDARYMISRLGMAEHVAALVTICTPHRGSPYADWVLANLGQRLGGARLAALLGLDLRAIADLTTAAARRFNEQTPDHPDVRYFAVSAACPLIRAAPIFAHASAVVTAAEGPNDGLVSVASAAWGEHLETWPIDHLHAINKRLHPGTILPQHDVTPRYRKILAHVRARSPVREHGVLASR